MATSFFIRSVAPDGSGILIARVRDRIRGIDFRKSTGIKVDADRWEKSKTSPTIQKNYRKDDPCVFEKTEALASRLDAALKEDGFTVEIMSSIIHEVVFAEAIKAEKERKEELQKKEEEAKRVTFMQYYTQFLEDMRSGKRTNERGVKYAYQTIKHFNQGYNKLVKYNKTRRRVVDWDNIDLSFYKDYTRFLRLEGYSVNTIGTRIKELKTIIRNANEDEVTTNNIYQNRKFKATEVDVDSVYITEEEMRMIQDADLSNYPVGYEWARDIFSVGVYTAQRVSDYNNIGKGNIMEINGRCFVEVKQKKTGRKVLIPCKSELIRILDKYENELPKLSDQKINEYIKEVAKVAGLTESVQITTSKGGVNKTESVPKYTLIHTHTARRTGATWMYLSGMDKFDIMKITGHSSVKLLDKYIKASELDSVRRIADYKYFA